MFGLNIFSVLLFGLFVCLNADSGSVERIYVRDNKPALKGSNIQLVCEIAQFNSDLLLIYKSDSRLPSSTAGVLSMVQCLPSVCLTHSIDRYTFSADKSNVFINITKVNRTDDQKWWTCAMSLQRKELYLNVITVPTSLLFEKLHNESYDLAQNSIQLKCRTDCCYPKPNISWYYSESHEDFFQVWPSVGMASNTQSTCRQPEKIYSSTLALPKYTAFPGNILKNVHFKCGIASFTGLVQPLYTNYFIGIKFAVRVTRAALTLASNRTTNSSSVFSGESLTLRCDTFISRPEATKVWFFETQERHRSLSISFTFIPGNSDNNTVIYCKAFNIQPESEAVISNKITLQVQERTRVTSFYIGQNENQTNATFGEHDVNIQLTCIVRGLPASDLFIIFNGDIIARQPNTNVLIYKLQSITCSDNGVYICTGIDNVGFATNKSATLFTECTPRPMRHILQNVTSELGQSVTFSFIVIAHPEPGPKGFTWFRESMKKWTSVLSDNYYYISSSSLETYLTIFNVSREGYGKYRVTAVNKIGSYDQIFVLSEKDYIPNKFKSNSDTAFLPAAIVLGIVCVILVGYALAITFRYIRATNIKDTAGSKGNKTKNDNIRDTGIINIAEEQDYENNVEKMDDDATKQYTELVHFSSDRTTYEQLQC